MSAIPTGVCGRPRLLLTALRENPTLIAGRMLAELHPPRTFDITLPSNTPDIVLHMESGYVGPLDLPLLLKQVGAHRQARHFLFSESDWPYAVLAGAYPSLTKGLPWAYSWSYLPSPSRSCCEILALAAERTYLFSFLGRTDTHWVRRQLVALDGPDTPCLSIADAPSRFANFDYTRSYLELIARSRFALCPRGFGASSIRLFEAMALGCAPVIISDAWQPPPGIAWPEFSVVVAEGEVMRIPQILRGLQTDADRMGKRAKEIFDQNFAPEVFFDRLLGLLLAQTTETDTVGAIASRAWHALGWREFYSIGHLAKSKLGSALRRAS
jgi:hypothetical protein